MLPLLSKNFEGARGCLCSSKRGGGGRLCHGTMAQWPVQAWKKTWLHTLWNLKKEGLDLHQKNCLDFCVLRRWEFSWGIRFVACLHYCQPKSHRQITFLLGSSFCLLNCFQMWFKRLNMMYVLWQIGERGARWRTGQDDDRLLAYAREVILLTYTDSSEAVYLPQVWAGWRHLAFFTR